MKYSDKILDTVFPNRNPWSVTCNHGEFLFTDSVHDPDPYKVFSIGFNTTKYTVFRVTFKLFGYKIMFRVRNKKDLKGAQKRFLIRLDRFSNRGYRQLYVYGDKQ